MKHIEIKAKYRNDLGKSFTKKLRKEEQVPCVIYGGKKNVNFYTHENQFLNLVFTPNVYLVDLDIEGDKYFCYLKEVQFHPVTDKVIHVDFIEIQEDKPIKISLPINLIGQSIGVKSGGKLIKNMRKLKVKGLVKDLPDKVDIDISDLDIGQSIQVKSIEFENLEFLDVASNMIAIVKSARGVAAGMEIEEPKTEEEEVKEGEAKEETKQETEATEQAADDSKGAGE